MFPKKSSYWALGLIYATSSWALSQKATDILNKKNRVLEPPPQSLRADNSNLDYRLKSESERMQKIDDEQPVQAMPSASADLNGNYWDNGKPLGNSSVRSSRSEKSSLRKKKRQEALEELRFSGERVFGLGLVGGGAYGVFGMEAQFAVIDSWIFGIGIGTGMTYSTWGVSARKFFKEGRLSTFFEGGYANWFLGKVPTQAKADTFLIDRFFKDSQGKFESGKRVHLVYPGIGVLYQHSSGLAIDATLDYLVSVNNFAGALFGSLGFYYFF